MARCPVCETNVSEHWMRGFLVGFFLALLVGFITGQLFHAWQYDGSFKAVIERLELRNEELKKGYVPPRK